MFGIGGFELFIILLFGFLIFGPEKLPEVARTVGKGIARFRQAQDEMNDVIKSTDIYDPNSDEPFKDPMEALDKLAKHQEEKRALQSESAKATKASPAGSSVAKKPSSQANASVKSATGAESKAESATVSDGGTGEPRRESFTERKARYERERAARKAAAEQAAAESACTSSTTTPAEVSASPASADGETSAEAPAASESTAQGSDA